MVPYRRTVGRRPSLLPNPTLRSPQTNRVNPHSRLEARDDPAQGGGAACTTAHAGGLPAAAECLGRVAARLGFVTSQIKEIEEARRKRLEQEPETGPHAMVRLLARVVGGGLETAGIV